MRDGCMDSPCLMRSGHVNSGPLANAAATPTLRRHALRSCGDGVGDDLATAHDDVPAHACAVRPTRSWRAVPTQLVAGPHRVQHRDELCVMTELAAHRVR